MDDWTNFNSTSPASNRTNGVPTTSTKGDNDSCRLFTPQHFANTINLSQPANDRDQSSAAAMFELEKQPSDTIDSSTGQAICFATAANWVVVGTSYNYLIRWYMGGDQDEKTLIPLSTKPEERIFELFISPNGKHILISMTNGTLYYIPTDSAVIKPTQIQKFKDIVQSVAWYQYDIDLISSGAATAAIAAGGNTANITNPTQRVLLGTTKGSLWELVLEDQRERALKQLYQLSTSNNTALPTSIQRNRRPSVTDMNGFDENDTDDALGPTTSATGSLSVATAITGIRVIRAGIDDRIRSSAVISPTSTLPKGTVSRWHCFFVTSSHEYKLSGGPTLEAMFSDPAIASGNLSFIELPGGLLLSSNQLSTFTPSPTTPISEQSYGEHLAQSLVSPESYGWLTAAGVYYAHLNPNCSQAVATATQTSDPFSISERLIEYPKIVDQDAIHHRISAGDGLGHKQHYLQPISILLLQFHVIFLFRQHLAIVNLVNGTVVMSVSLPKNSFGSTRKLAMDETNNLYWLLTDNSLYEIIVSNEGKDIWRLYLSQGDFDNAYQHCTTSHQSKIVSTAHSDALFQQGNYFQAAQQFIRSTRTFEAVCMKYLTEYQQYSTTNNIQIENDAGSSLMNGSSSKHALDDSTPKSKLSAISSNINNGMPNSLFTSTMSTLFGPSQFTSNSLGGHKLFSPSQSAIAQDVDPSSSLAMISSHDPSAASSLSLLVSTMSLTSHKDHSTPNPNQGTKTGGQTNSSSYAYIYTMFSLLEKKWAIYSGLKTYLKLMLTHISQSDKTKLTTLASWVIEISVNTLVSLQTSFLPQTSSHHSDRAISAPGSLIEEHGSQVSPEIISLEEQRIQLYNQECKDLEELIQDYLDVLHPTTTYQLLSIAGRSKECLFYAKLNKHYRYVFDMYLREKLFLEALDYLRTLRRRITTPTSSTAMTQSQLDMIKYLNPLPSTTTSQPHPMSFSFTIEPDIIYRIIPTLLQHHPSQLVDLLIETDGLQSTQVLTAMVRSGLHIEFTVSPDAVDIRTSAKSSGVTTVVDPSKRLLQNTLSQFDLNLSPESSNLTPNNKNSATTKAPTISDQDIASSLNNPSNIKSFNVGAKNLETKNYLYHVSRYLVTLISSGVAPPAAHNLYVALLIQLRDATRLYNYLISQKHATSPNRAFSLRLALPHVDELYSSVIELCLQLQRYTLAIRFAMRYDNRTAKIILKTMTTSTSSVIPMSITGDSSGSGSLVAESPHGSTNVEQSLWQEYVQLLFSQGLSISQIIQDIRSWFSGEEVGGVSNISAPLISSSGSSTANNTTLLKILPSLPTTITISDIQSNVITQLVDFNNQLNQLNLDMSALHLTNNNLKYQLHSLQQQIIAVSTSQRCDICSQPVMLSPFIYFRCGHVFHMLCCVNTVVDHINSFSPAATIAYNPPTHNDGQSNFNQQLAFSLSAPPAAQTRSLSKKQNIFLRLLNDLHDDLTTTASLSQTALQDVDQNFCSDEVMDLVSIQGLKHKVLTGALTQEEELFFFEQYAQESCVCCGELIIESIGLNVGTGGIDDLDWSL